MTTPLRLVDKPEGLLDIPGAADWLAVSESTVKRLLAAGDLTYVRVASVRRISIDALRGYVAAREAAVTPTRRLRHAL